MTSATDSQMAQKRADTKRTGKISIVEPREMAFGCFLLHYSFSFSTDLSFFKIKRCMCVGGGRRTK